MKSFFINLLTNIKKKNWFMYIVKIIAIMFFIGVITDDIKAEDYSDKCMKAGGVAMFSSSLHVKRCISNFDTLKLIDIL